MIKEKSCGMVVFKEENDNLYILIVKHSAGHWGLPKGYVEEGEEGTFVSIEDEDEFNRVCDYIESLADEVE